MSRGEDKGKTATIAYSSDANTVGVGTHCNVMGLHSITVALAKLLPGNNTVSFCRTGTRRASGTKMGVGADVVFVDEVVVVVVEEEDDEVVVEVERVADAHKNNMSEVRNFMMIDYSSCTRYKCMYIAVVSCWSSTEVMTTIYF